jgi:ATP-dependent Clp protease ATP-binding subunit ClpA
MPSIFKKRPHIFDRFSPQARRAVFHAAHGASARNSQEITAADLLLGIAKEKHHDECPFRLVHERREQLALALGLPLTPMEYVALDPERSPKLSTGSKQSILLARTEAKRNDCYWIDRDDLQAALIQTDAGVNTALSSIGFSLEATREYARQARQRWPEKQPTLTQRLQGVSLLTWVVVGFIVGFLAINLVNLMLSR